ncbi:MAG: M3 family metallopeptidase [Bacteroidales bacterium]|nr:M3 family metallopeptidase [Bacteroidales bacterium]
MKKIIMVLIVPIFLLSSCSKEKKQSTNPFFSEFKTPFNVPPFDKIDTSHYIPAFEQGMIDQQAEIDAIINNSDAPTFDNTILTYDRSGALLSNVGRVFSTVNGANTNPALQAINRKVASKTTKHRDNISLNEKLFQRIKAVYENREKSNLDAEQIRVVEKYYEDFVRNGANLSETDKAKLREINQKLSKYSIKFTENVLAETNTNFKLVIDNNEDLAGLPQGIIDAAAEDAKNDSLIGKWKFTLQKPSMIPFLQYAKNRNLREKLYRGYFMRCNNNDKFDNKEILVNIANLRVERANLLGYKTYAEYSISKNMAQIPDKVYEFLKGIFNPAQEVAKKDLDAMQKIVEKEGGKFKIEPWDWWYYAEKLKKEKFNLDESELKPYFAAGNVRDGMFYVANKLYGLTFIKQLNVPVYNSDVETYEVKEADGSYAGILYIDLYIRAGKRPGAWCGTIRDQVYENGKRVPPIVSMVCNFPRPNGDSPALLTWDDVNTLFHEFGHGLHNFCVDGKYDRTAGSLPRDMVELPSQFMENYAAQPEIIKYYGTHYKTGKIIPDELLEKLKKSMVFNQGFETVELVAASLLDLDWHSLTEPKNIDALAFEKASMDNIKLMKEILPRYRSTYFSHIIGGYSAGYYVYLWAAVLDSDAFQAFVDSGDIFNQEIAGKFRKYVLKEGGKDEGMIQYRKFRGQDPSLDPLLKKRGLK